MTTKEAYEQGFYAAMGRPTVYFGLGWRGNPSFDDRFGDFALSRQMTLVHRQPIWKRLLSRR